MDVRQYKMLINGAWVDAKDGQTFDSINPSTGNVWASFPEATHDDVDMAVQAAHIACTNGPWASMTPSKRGHHLRILGDLLAEHANEIGLIETTDTGKLLKETCWQTAYMKEFLYFYAGCADKIQGETLPIDKPDMFVFTKREPLGVVAAIIPWNSQLFLTMVKLGPALAAGNSIVIKTSEQAPAPLLVFGELIQKAGIPDGVVNIITGHGEPCGKSLTSHPLVAKVAFTGGGESAKHIIKNTSHNFAQISLELGGKSPFIICDDADIDSAVNGAISGIFGASGQSCVAGSRLIVHESIADIVLDKMVDIARHINIGDPTLDDTEMGPLCTLNQLQNIEQNIVKAEQQGARVIYGGKRLQAPSNMFFEPTIIDCPNANIDIVDTELFGPVLSVLRFKDESEAIALANQSVHGLAAGIFTKDNGRALRMMDKIKAGIIWVNTYRAVSPIAAFGGMKHSGYGRESGLEAVYAYTQTKTVWMNMSSAPLGSQFIAR